VNALLIKIGFINSRVDQRSAIHRFTHAPAAPEIQPWTAKELIADIHARIFRLLIQVAFHQKRLSVVLTS